MTKFALLVRGSQVCFQHAQLVAACYIVLAIGQFSWASQVRVNGDDNNTATTEAEEATTYVFTNLRAGDLSVPSNTSADLAEGVLPVIITGTPHGLSATIGVLTNGTGGTDDGIAEKFFFDNTTSSQLLRISLAQVSAVGQINSYSWHKNTDPGGDADNRAHQMYNVWASDGTAGGFLINDQTSPGWTLLATAAQTDTRAILGNTDGQVGVSVNPDSGSLLGNYQHFIFEFFPNNPTGGTDNHTFLSEIDILEEVPAVPEPSTLMISGIGMAALAVVHRRRRG